MSTRSNIKPLSLKANTIWNSAGSMVYFGVQWLITVLVVVLSDGYQHSGELAIAMAVGNVFAPVALFRIRMYQISDIKDRFSQQNYIAFRFVTIAVAFVFAAIYSVITQIGLSLLVLVAIYLLFKADESFADVLYGIEQRGHRMDYIGISQAIRGVLSLVTFTVGLAVFNNLLLSISLMAVTCFLVTCLFDIPHARRFGKVKPDIRPGLALELFKACLPAALSLLFCTAVISVARQYLSIHSGEDVLGIYAAIATPTLIIQIAASYIYVPAGVHIAELFHDGKKAELTGLIQKLLLLILTAVLAFIVAAVLFGNRALEVVYGASILPHTYILLPVCVATGLTPLFWFLLDLLVMMREFKYLLVVSVSALVSGLCIMVPAINILGMNGVNAVIICSYIVGILLALVFVVRRISKISVENLPEHSSSHP